MHLQVMPGYCFSNNIKTINDVVSVSPGLSRRVVSTLLIL